MDVTLTTQRLLLRPPVATDAAAIALYLNSFAIAGKLSRVPYPYTEADAEAWLATCNSSRPGGEVRFVIAFAAQGLVGVCSLNDDVSGITLGYWLAEGYWNRGIMTEAASAVIAWYFESSDATVLYSGAFAFNRASLAVQHKLGFTESGVSQRHCLARHQDLRHIDTQLSRERWQHRSRARQLQVNR